jgi:molybdate transport system regulatory protein
MNNIKLKIQIFHDDHNAFGPGKAQLLVAICNHGSISAAARSIDMSYKRAWELVDGMNKGFKQELVVRRIGGAHGGGAEVTEFGLKILALYKEAVEKSQQYIDNQMAELISNLKP